MLSDVSWSDSIPHIVVGVLMGLGAFVPLAAALRPVLKGTNRVSMVAGLLAIGASSAVLLVGVFAVHLLDGDGLVPFAVGEMGGFVGALVVISTVLVAKLGR